jgi:hypothetical protein
MATKWIKNSLNMRKMKENGGKTKQNWGEERRKKERVRSDLMCVDQLILRWGCPTPSASGFFGERRPQPVLSVGYDTVNLTFQVLDPR